jgi:hypothetical protein
LFFADLASNVSTAGVPRIEAALLKWERDPQPQAVFDVIIAADWSVPCLGLFSIRCRFVVCSLFFVNYHAELIDTLRAHLAPGGQVLLVAPRRGKTMNLFIAAASSVFDIHVRTSL